MSNFWQQKLQSSLQSSLQSVNSTVSSISTDGAARLKSLAQAVDGASAAPKPAHQFLRLPVESARKLRYYDRPDLADLVTQHAQDKAQMQAAIDALRRILGERGLREEELDGAVQAQLAEVAALRAADEGVSMVLLAAAQAEMDALRARAAEEAARAAGLEARLATSPGVAATCSPSPSAAPPPAADLGSPGLRAPPAGTPPREGGTQDGRQHESPDSPQSALQQCEDLGTPAAEAIRGPSDKQLLDVWDSGGRDLAGLNPDLGEEAPPVGEAAGGGLGAEQQHSAALMGKLQRLEEERLAHEDQLSEASAKVCSLEAAVAAAQAESAGRLRELRSRLGANTAQQSDMLRTAQRICQEAEERADAADTQLGALGERCVRLEAERAAAELRANKAEAAADSTRIKGAQDSEWGRAQVGKLAELEEEAADVRRALGAAEAEGIVLETRLAEALAAEAATAAELRDAELLLSDRESLAARAKGLEEALEEARTQRGQLENYKQLAREMEVAKARVDAELLATAQMAAGLEARVRGAQAAAQGAQLLAAAAELRAREAAERVEAEVAEKLAAIGADRALWPALAREAAAQAEARAGTLASMMAALQGELDSDAGARLRERRQLAAVRERLEEALEEGGRAVARREEALQTLSCEVAAARAEAAQLRHQLAEEAASTAAAAAAEREREQANQRMPQTPRRGGGGLLGAMANGGKANGRSSGGSGSGGSPGPLHEDLLTNLDILYLKNVVLKFIEAQSGGRWQERDALLPAVATLLRATSAEYRALKLKIESGDSPIGWLTG